MRRALRIGLTGGIGTGKSEALKAFRACGAEVYSLDEMAHAMMRKGRPAFRALVKEFGREILDSRGEIDRRALGERVFARRPLRRRLEALTHPRILRQMRRALRSSRGPVVIADVPLLFEAGLSSEFDATVLVAASPSAQLARVMRRDRLTRSGALRRIRAQWPIGRKEKLADVVIRNDGSLAGLRRSARQYQKAFELIAS